jgi:hypothetical protein
MRCRSFYTLGLKATQCARHELRIAEFLRELWSRPLFPTMSLLEPQFETVDASALVEAALREQPKGTVARNQATSADANVLRSMPRPDAATNASSSMLLMPSAEHSSDPSLFALLGLLSAFRSRIRCSTLEQLFGKINLDARSWSLLRRSRLTPNEVTAGMEQLRDTLIEFLTRVHRKAPVGVVLPSLLSEPLYTEEVNFAQRVFSRSHALQQQCHRALGPLCTELETYLDGERASITPCDLRELYSLRKAEIEELFREMEARTEDDVAKLDGTAGPTSRRDSTVSIQSTAAPSRGSMVSGNPPAKSTTPAISGGFVPRSRAASRGPSRGASRQTSRRPSLSKDPNGQSLTSLGKSHAQSHSLSLPSGGPAAAVSSSSTGSRTGSMVDTLADGKDAAISIATNSVSPPVAVSTPSDDSEEEDLASRGPVDLFSKLLDQTRTHCYPLPARVRHQQQPPSSAAGHPTHSRNSSGPLSVAVLPQADFLRPYIEAHCKSFRLAELLLDSYLSATQAQFVALAIAECTQKPDQYAEVQTAVQKSAANFVQVGLPLMARILALEPTFLATNLMQLSFLGVEAGRLYSDARQLLRKARLLHGMWSACDVYVLPRSIDAHACGSACKTLCCSYTDSSYIASGGFDRMVRVWDVRPGAGRGTTEGHCLAQFVGHRSVITWVGFTRGDTELISTSLDGEARVWNARTAECLHVMRGHSDGILCGAMAPGDGGGVSHGTVSARFFATGSMDCSLRLWSPTHERCLRVYRGHRHWVKTVRFTLDGQTMISGGCDHTILVWALKGAGTDTGSGGLAAAQAIGGAPRHVLLAHTAPILDLLPLSFNGPHASRFVSAGKDCTLRVWDWRSGKEVTQLANPAGSIPLSLSLSPGSAGVRSSVGAFLAVAFSDHTLSIYDARMEDLKLIRRLHIHNEGLSCVQWISDDTIAVGTSTGKMQILRL